MMMTDEYKDNIYIYTHTHIYIYTNTHIYIYIYIYIYNAYNTKLCMVYIFNKHFTLIIL